MLGNDLLRILCGAFAALTGFCFIYQAVYLFVPFFAGKEKKCKAQPSGRRYAVLIAARNERAVLPHLINSIKAQDYPKELTDIYVVADNCTDDTALLARRAGATVYERRDDDNIGKGYALNFLLGSIERERGLNSHDAFMVFDADNLLEPNYITEMDKTLESGYEALCGYRNSKNFGDNWLSSGYALWYMHDSCHLNRSRMLLGTSCAVTGTGFLFTRGLLERLCGWNFFTLTEDIEFNVVCAINGIKIGFCPDAVLYDEQPVLMRQSWWQRTRWVQGGIQLAFRYGGSLLRGIFTQKKGRFACFEMLTLSLWGYIVGTLGGLMGSLFARLSGREVGGIILTAISGAYLSLFLVGVLTTITKWKKIKAPAVKKIAYLFTFPFFGLAFVPIAVYAVFAPFSWKPIEHSVALSLADINK